jgi:hypothetical protein
MRHLLIYVDASVVGGCEDEEFSEDSLRRCCVMKKTFDAVEWMRRRRTEIDAEDRGLSWEDKRRKTHDIVMRDPLLAPLYVPAKPHPDHPASNATRGVRSNANTESRPARD